MMMKHVWIVFAEGVAVDVRLERPDPLKWPDPIHIPLFDPASISDFEKILCIKERAFDTLKEIAHAITTRVQFTEGTHNLCLCLFQQTESSLALLAVESDKPITHLDDRRVFQCYGVNMPPELKELFTRSSLFCMFSEIATQAFERD